VAVDVEEHLINTEIFKYPAFQALNGPARFCLLTLLSSPLTALWGICRLDLGVLTGYLDGTEEETGAALEELGAAGFIKCLPERNLLWVPDWWNYHGVADEEARDYCLAKLEGFAGLDGELDEFIELSRKILLVAPPYPEEDRAAGRES
jgi:hypothetical protein